MWEVNPAPSFGEDLTLDHLVSPRHSRAHLLCGHQRQPIATAGPCRVSTTMLREWTGFLFVEELSLSSSKPRERTFVSVHGHMWQRIPKGRSFRKLISAPDRPEDCGRSSWAGRPASYSRSSGRKVRSTDTLPRQLACFLAAGITFFDNTAVTEPLCLQTASLFRRAHSSWMRIRERHSTPAPFNTSPNREAYSRAACQHNLLLVGHVRVMMSGSA